MSFSFSSNEEFPNFEGTTYKGKEFSNKDFLGKKTFVLMGHIECPPMLKLMVDLDSLQQVIDTSKFQIIGILENTTDHLDQFFSNDTASIYVTLKNKFKIDTLRYPLIAECETEKTKTKNGILLIKNHCRKLAKKVHTKSSPTYFLVDENGVILKRHDGYIMYGTAQQRMDFLNDFIE